MRYLGLVLITAVAFSLLAIGPCGGGKSDAEKASDALNRGLEAHLAGRLDEATTAYRETLALDPQNKFAYFNLGLIDQTQARLEAAENNYRVALSIDPDFTSALFNLAIVRKARGDTADAIQLYRHVISLLPDNAGAHLNLGLLLRETGHGQEGDAEVQKAVQLDPTLQGRLAGSPTAAPRSIGPQPTSTP